MPLTSFTELLPAVVKNAGTVSFSGPVRTDSTDFKASPLTHSTQEAESGLLTSPFTCRGFDVGLPYRLVLSLWCPDLCDLPTVTAGRSTGMATSHPAKGIAGTKDDKAAGLAVGMNSEWQLSCLLWQSRLLTDRQHGLLREKVTHSEIREEHHAWVKTTC